MIAQAKPNLIDRVLSYVAPQRAARWMRAPCSRQWRAAS